MKKRGASRICIALLSAALSSATFADGASDSGEARFTFAGHIKYQFLYQAFPDNSIFRTVLGSQAMDNSLETRLKFSVAREKWDFKADYQFINIYADTLPLATRLPDSAFPANSVIDDDRRWWNLTYSTTAGDKYAMIHRLDRLSVGFTTDKTAWRFGRQAISWGNGMIFTPMDVFNPFDPAAVDKEYKTGDDMLYGQYLQTNGNDLQAVAVVRRDPRSGNVDSDQSSLALKYHGFIGMNEFDLLAAEHYDDLIFGIGGSVDVGTAIWRGDLTWTDTDLESVFSLATSLSWSWIWGGKNISGLIEYYYNGFGQTGGAYAIGDLEQNPDLARRLERGELFTLARHYIATSLTVEMTPLLMFNPNIFINLNDPSALAQFVASYNWTQNLQLLAALNVPVGPDGSEYGGTIAPLNIAPMDRRYFSAGPSVYAQLAWYF